MQQVAAITRSSITGIPHVGGTALADDKPRGERVSTTRSDRDAHSTVQTNVSRAAGDASMLNRVSPPSALPSTSPRRSAVPTVVLVHGAFADTSSWGGVIVELQSAGISVLAPPNPLRSLDGDAAYIAERVRQIDGPVLLVGHSYGGAVITVAGAAAHNVVGLVYIAAFIPDEGESLAEIGAPFPQSRLAEVVRQNTAAVSQRPLAASALFVDTASAAAWRTLPSWAIIPTGDESIHPDAQRFMAPASRSAGDRGSRTAHGDGVRARTRGRSHPRRDGRASLARLSAPPGGRRPSETSPATGGRGHQPGAIPSVSSSRLRFGPSHRLLTSRPARSVPARTNTSACRRRRPPRASSPMPASSGTRSTTATPPRHCLGVPDILGSAVDATGSRQQCRNASGRRGYCRPAPRTFAPT
jgi:pimeloyl-ACP methyl ester carboxylesterase